MQIDLFAPHYDVAERHQTLIRAPTERVYQAVRSLDLSRSRLVRSLFRLRGMSDECLTLDGLLKMGFVLLDEVPNRELVLGLVGRFWLPSGEIQIVEAKDFRSFERSGYAKAVWNFSVEPQGAGVTRLATETRVFCLDEQSRRKFRLYWLFIMPFSGIIRREALRAVKRAAEGNGEKS